MDLREYLFRKRIKITHFAKQINYGRTYVNEIVNGTRKPGKKLALCIEKETNGEVTLVSLLENFTKNKLESKSKKSSNERNQNFENPSLEPSKSPKTRKALKALGTKQKTANRI
jgi:hypothetical protein